MTAAAGRVRGCPRHASPAGSVEDAGDGHDSPTVENSILLIGVLPRILLVGVLSSPMRRSSSTANAILGLLALRPSWSTWELTTQLRRNMRFFWPRAESRIFAEPRRLESSGLPRTQTPCVGPRPPPPSPSTPPHRNTVTPSLAST